MLNQFTVMSTLHQVLLKTSEQASELIKVSKFTLTEEKKVIAVQCETETDEQALIKVPVSIFNEYYNRLESVVKTVYTTGYKKHNVYCIASKEYLKSIDIDTQSNFSKVDIEEVTTYNDVIDRLARYKYRSRLEKQSLVFSFGYLPKIDTLVKHIKSLKLQTSLPKQTYVITNLEKILLNVDFALFDEFITHYYYFRMSLSDSRKIQLSVLAIIKLWIELGYKVPQEILLIANDFLENIRLNYVLDPSGVEGYHGLIRTITMCDLSDLLKIHN